MESMCRESKSNIILTAKVNNAAWWATLWEPIDMLVHHWASRLALANVTLKLYKTLKKTLTAQLLHLDAKCIQKHATTVGLYCKHIVVKCRLFEAMKYEVCAKSFGAEKKNNKIETIYFLLYKGRKIVIRASSILPVLRPGTTLRLSMCVTIANSLWF